MHALLFLSLATDVATPTPTPESPHFPADPLIVLRYGWPFLVVYYVIAIPAVSFLWRDLKASRFLHSTKLRLITAAVLAAVFTPSEVSDFFLFNLPGPAVAGLFMLLIALGMIAFSDPFALLQPAVWGAIASYYVLPLLIGFSIAYLALWSYHRLHPGPIPPPEQRLQPNR